MSVPTGCCYDESPKYPEPKWLTAPDCTGFWWTFWKHSGEMTIASVYSLAGTNCIRLRCEVIGGDGSCLLSDFEPFWLPIITPTLPKEKQT
jgi:hypothetical protein